MHFPFDINKISFKQIKLKSINPMTGYLGYIDESVTSKEKIIRMDCPKSVLRIYKNTYESTTYIIPHDVNLMMYGEHVVAMERTDLNVENQQLKRVFDKVISLLNPNYEWYFDGSYIYSFFGSQDNAINSGENMTEDGKFKAIKAKAIFINYIGFSDDVYVEDRQCIGYISNNQYSISTPIWKMLNGIGDKKLNDDATLSSQFDSIDYHTLVNLQFAINAGNMLSKQFGYQIIEPLQLPRLMVQLKTVNLRAVPTGTKQTFDIGLKFTQAMAWLLGINKTKVTTFDDMLVMRQLFRYLSANGIYSKSKMKNIYTNDDHNIQLMSIDSLKAKYAQK